ncbi:hypothetical protein M5689_015552 [Euphorbia peplus]|nr:hypothetical protein M5689_015552 [Euphorbia peplus]
MGSTEGLMGISSDILGDYYDKHPCPSLSNDVDVLSSQIQAMAFNLLDESADEKLLVDELNRHPFYKIERNLWKNREHIEEIIDLLTPSTHEDTELAGILDNITHVLAHSLTNLVSFLDMISQTVFTAVTFRLPHADARRLVKKLKGQEENDKAKFDDLVASGASIGARCALLWGQQMKRRRELAECCNSIALTRIRYRNTIPNVSSDMELEFDFAAAAIEACYNLPSDEEFFKALVSDYDTDEFSDDEDYNPEQLFLDSLINR